MSLALEIDRLRLELLRQADYARARTDEALSIARDLAHTAHMELSNRAAEDERYAAITKRLSALAEPRTLQPYDQHPTLPAHNVGHDHHSGRPH